MDKTEVIRSTKKALCTLEDYALSGLPDRYATFDAAMSDWYNLLPQIEQESICAFEFLTSDSDAASVADLVLKIYNYDLMKQWKAEQSR